MSLAVTAVALTDVGLRRENNEDQYALSGKRTDLWWGVVCDGMGGVEGGEIASEMAASAFRLGMERLRREDATADRIAGIIVDANDLILERARDTPFLDCMGTTLSALIVDLENSRALIAHAGDSRAYRLRGKKLQRLTFDHNAAQDLLRAGLIEPGRERFVRNATALTRVVGMEDFPGPEIIAEDIAAGDLFLLCSDGLTNVLTDGEIRSLLNSKEVEASALKLVDATKRRGAPDNVTVVLARVDGIIPAA